LTLFSCEQQHLLFSLSGPSRELLFEERDREREGEKRHAVPERDPVAEKKEPNQPGSLNLNYLSCNK